MNAPPRQLGEAGTALVQELKQAEFITQFNDELVRKVIKETNEMYEAIEATIRDVKEIQANAVDETDSASEQHAASLLVEWLTILRNKRCSLAYLMNRLNRLKKIWWQSGSIMAPVLKEKLSSSEIGWYQEYDTLMANYMKDTGVLISDDQSPPKSLFVEVRCMDDVGDIVTDSGEVIQLHKNTAHYLPRANVQQLIRQGVCIQTTPDKV